MKMLAWVFCVRVVTASWHQRFSAARKISPPGTKSSAIAIQFLQSNYFVNFCLLVFVPPCSLGLNTQLTQPKYISIFSQLYVWFVWNMREMINKKSLWTFVVFRFISFWVANPTMRLPNLFVWNKLVMPADKSMARRRNVEIRKIGATHTHHAIVRILACINTFDFESLLVRLLPLQIFVPSLEQRIWNISKVHSALCVSLLFYNY